jgi:3-hydroxypropanoate dehydrogenase
MGAASANSSPARFVWVRSTDGKATLAGLAAEPNKPKILEAAVTVIIGHDLDFAGELPTLCLTLPRLCSSTLRHHTWPR